MTDVFTPALRERLDEQVRYARDRGYVLTGLRVSRAGLAALKALMGHPAYEVDVAGADCTYRGIPLGASRGVWPDDYVGAKGFVRRSS